MTPTEPIPGVDQYTDDMSEVVGEAGPLWRHQDLFVEPPSEEVET